MDYDLEPYTPEPKVVECPECNGKGKVNDTDDLQDKQFIPCYVCEGSGYVDIDPQDGIDREADLLHDDI